MRLLKALSLLAALGLLGGAVLDAQTGLVRQALGAAPDAGRKGGTNADLGDLYVPASKAGPLIRPRNLQPSPQQSPTQAAAPEPKKDAGK